MEKKHWRFYQKRIDHNYHHDLYILRTKGVYKASIDAIDIMKFAGGIVGGVLVKDYAVYKKWSKSDTTLKFYSAIKGNTIDQPCASITFQSLKYGWDQWHLGEPLHLQG